MTLIWISLPAEIRCMTLKYVAKNYKFDSAKPYLRAGYATVCREWQAVFEEENFEKLHLNQDRVYGLKEFMSMEANIFRQKYIYSIFLCIQLGEYDYTVCKLKEDDATIRANNDIFSKAIYSLLVILSGWKLLTRLLGRRRDQKMGLVLELAAYSPSDCKYTFRDFHLECNYPFNDLYTLEPNFETYKKRADRLGLDNLDDPYHGWVNGHRNGKLSKGSRQRILGH